MDRPRLSGGTEEAGGCVRGGVLIPLFVLVGQKEVLHLLAAEIDLVLIVALDGLRLVHRVVQGEEELLEGLHHRGRGGHVNIVDVSQSERQQKKNV